MKCSGRAAHILLVEDDDLVRDHVQTLLDTLGYAVTTAANGPEALAMLDQGLEVDLLFTDVIMPGGLNGREVADEAVAKRPGLPVLFTSGYAQNALMTQGRLEPGMHLLSKPYRRGDLAAKIQEVLSAANRRADSA